MNYYKSFLKMANSEFDTRLIQLTIYLMDKSAILSLLEKPSKESMSPQ